MKKPIVNRFGLWSLLLLLACLFTGCPDDEEVFEPMEPEPFTCQDDFEVNATGDGCVCPPDKIQQDTFLCYTLPEGYWYADMEGCDWEIGMSFGEDPIFPSWTLGDTTTPWVRYATFSNMDFVAYEYNIRVVRPMPKSSGNLRSSPSNLYLGQTSSGFDSIVFKVSDLEWIMPGLDYPPGGGRELQFRGNLTHPDTIRGTFFWGYEDFSMPNTFATPTLYSCEGTFVLGG
jgi:hypothetical protein